MTDDEVLQAIADALSKLETPGMVGSWVVAYEVSAIDEDGDVGANWGYLANANAPTIIGLAHLVANDAQRLND